MNGKNGNTSLLAIIGFITVVVLFGWFAVGVISAVGGVVASIALTLLVLATPIVIIAVIIGTVSWIFGLFKK